MAETIQVDTAENSNSNSANPRQQVAIMDILKGLKQNWIWVTISIIACLVCAFFYTQSTPPEYMRQASILIRDDSPGRSIDAKNEFAELGLLSSYRSIYDEIEVIASRDIMADVVDKYNLDISYHNASGLMHNSLYTDNLPVQAVFSGFSPDDNISFRVTSDGNTHAALSEGYFNKEEIDLPATVTYGIPVRIKAVTENGDKIDGTLTIVKTPNWESDEEFVIDIAKRNREDVINIYTSRLQVKNKEEKSSVLDLSFTDESPRRADDILNGVIEAYNNSWIKTRNQITEATDKFINERLDIIQQELGSVDSSISSFKSRNKLPDVEATSKIYLDQEAENYKQLFEINNQLQITRYLRDHMNREGNKYEVLPANSGINNLNIEKQISDYNDLVISRSSYLNNYSEAHPVVQDIDMRIKAVKSGLISSIDNQIKSLSTTLNNLERKEAANSARLSSAPTQARVLLSAERQQQVKEQLYLYLLQKREENQLTRNSIAPNNRVITSVHGQREPITTPASRIYLLAFVIGLAIPSLIIFALKAFDTRVRSRNEFESVTVPFIGEIPQYHDHHNRISRIVAEMFPQRIDHDPKHQLGLVVEEGNRNIINEAFRVIRTNIGLMSGKESHQIIMVSSFNPGSGKTFITINIGMSLAIKGKKVLIIDGDFRRCSLSAFAGNPHHGITDYLSEKNNNLESLIVTSPKNDNLHILPVGFIPPNPTELLESRKFSDMVKGMREQYDYVFIDCPPSEIMADAQIINTVVDRTLFVTRAGLLDRSMLPVLQKMYDEQRFKNMGVILNGTANADFAYAHGYSYGYGYGYGYGNNKKEN